MAKSDPAVNSSFSLTAQSPLGGHHVITDGVSLIEITDLSIVSVAPLMGGETSFKSAIAKLFNAGTPSATMALERTGKGRCFIMPSAHNQWFLVFDDDHSDPLDAAIGLLGKNTKPHLAMTDQSDSWAVLALSGIEARQILERICPIDCSAAAMPIGTTARTMMEHLGVIITRRPDTDDGAPCFWLFSARSSAASFLHAITTTPPFHT